MSPRERHAALVAQLQAVEQQQRALQSETLVFLQDLAAPEKTGVQQALRELLLTTPDVTVLCAQTGAVVERIANANDVAEKMTREVRRIDIIQSRMSQCLTQSSQLLSLRNALVGSRRAMQQQNYPEAARFLKQLKEIEALMALDVADKLRMDTIENDLKGIIEAAFEDGMREGDKHKIQTYAPLFRVVGRDYEERGFEQLCSYVTASLDDQLEPLMHGSFSTKELLEHLTIVFNQIAAVAQENDQLMKSCFQRVSGTNRLVASIYAIGEKASVKVLDAYMAQRKFHDRITSSKEASEPATNAGNSARTPPNSRPSSAAPTEDAIAVLNEQLNEIALVIQHTQTYERFMRSRVLVPEDSDDDEPADDPADVLPPSHESELGKTVQELAGFYCYFENELLSKAARKAFQWEEIRFSSSSAVNDSEVLCFPISSAVDEIFYVARNSGLRALATGHVDCAAGVLNMINTVLRDDLGDTMRSRIRQMTSYVKFDSDAGALGGPSQLRDQMQQQLAKLSKTMGPTIQTAIVTPPGSEMRKECGPDVVMNSLEATTEYIAQIKSQFESELPDAFPEVPPHILTCLSGLEDSSIELGQLLLAARKKLCKILEPKIMSYLGPLLMPTSKRAVQYELTDQMFTANEANDPFAKLFVACMGELLGAFKRTLSGSNYEQLAEITARCSAELLEKWFHSRHVRFNQLGALQFDKDLRTISAFFGEACECHAVFAPLMQIATVLNVDEPEDVLEVFGRRSRGVEWKLSAARVKEILSRRVEFADAAINKLNLT